MAAIAVLLAGGALAGYFLLLKPSVPATESDWNASENAAVENIQGTQDDVYACARDGDCISVAAGVCGCGEGGGATAINYRYAGYWNKKISEKSANSLITCQDVISQSPSCSMKPRCVRGACKLVK